MSHTEQAAQLGALQEDLVRLVSGFPGTLLYDVPLAPATVSNAPSFGINVMQQLLMLGLNPHFATVLGLLFVDTDISPGVTYDYCITGYWGRTLCASTTLYPGRAPAAALAHGQASFAGMTVSVDQTSYPISMWRWTRDDPKGQYLAQVDPGAPTTLDLGFQSAIGSIPQAQQPEGMLAVTWSPGVAVPPLNAPPVLPPRTLAIALKQPVTSVDIQLSGHGTVFARSNGVDLVSFAFSMSTLQTVSLVAPSPDSAMIDEIRVEGSANASTFVVGRLTTHLLPGDFIGTRCAMVRGSHRMSPIAPPLNPVVATFRHRQADINTTKLTLVPHSLINVEWPAPMTAAPQQGHPIDDPYGLPPPTQPIGFVAERQDSLVLGSPLRLPRIIANASSPTPKPNQGTVYPIPTPRLYRLPDRAADPVGWWQYRIAAFDLFGALGTWSGWTPPLGVEKIAAPATGLSIQYFDNQDSSGGAPFPAAPEPATAWIGGTLNARANWAASAFMMYPDTKSARAITESIGTDGAATGMLVYQDLALPAPTITQHTITSLVATLDPTPAAAGLYNIVIQTDPPLPVLDSTMPPAVLRVSILAETDPNYDERSDRYVVRPFISTIPDPNALGSTIPGPVVTQLSVGAASPLVTDSMSYVGKNAYLVQGYSTSLTMSVPLSIPVGEKTARGQLSVQTSISDPFDPNEKIVDPNGVHAVRDKSPPVTATFVGPLRLLPPTPPCPPQDNNHLYYDPADFTGRAGKDLVFETAQPAGVSGYVLLRAAFGSLALADIARRTGLQPPNAADPNPVIANRLDLAAWVAAIPTWLHTYNAGLVDAYKRAVEAFDAEVAAASAAAAAALAANLPPPTAPAAPVPPVAPTALTTGNVLRDAKAQNAFIEHFYGGMLDDELRALADLPPVQTSPTRPDNSKAFARVSTTPFTDFGRQIRDTVDGNGFGRNLYKVASVNSAGSQSPLSGAIGPYYTQVVARPKPPVIYRVLPKAGALKVEWMLDANPDVAAYLVYRGATIDELKDLRYFGADPAHPMATGLAAIECDLTLVDPLFFGVGQIDPRIAGLVPDPRLFARDYNGSAMGEVPLPAGPAPGQVRGVYRLSSYRDDLDPLNQPQAFNYWSDPPGVGTTCEVFTAGSTQSRLRGLRVGLGGRSVPVVVVATYGGVVKVFGTVPARRASFTDGMRPGNVPVDPNSVGAYTGPMTGANWYAVVAVDIHGNRSQPSKALANTMLP